MKDVGHRNAAATAVTSVREDTCSDTHAWRLGLVSGAGWGLLVVAIRVAELVFTNTTDRPAALLPHLGFIVLIWGGIGLLSGGLYYGVTNYMLLETVALGSVGALVGGAVVGIANRGRVLPRSREGQLPPPGGGE